MNNQKGFTLVEIIVTVVILAILMAVAVPVSMSYFDDVHEKRIINEAQSVFHVAESGSRSNRASLNGTYHSSSGTYYEVNNDILQSYVSKANGSGAIKDLRFENDKISYFRYKYDETTYVLYTKESNEFVIETNPDLSTIAEIIMTSEEPMSQIKDYFNTKAVGSVADSEAPSKEATGGKLHGIGSAISRWLNDSGINSDYFSWKIIFEKKETDNRMCEHKFRYVYAMYICNEKITKAMVGKELEVCVYKFYADGCVYNLDDSFGSTIKCKVIMQTTQGYTYPILQIP